MKDLIIIGAGPAGLTASIYGIRAGLDLALVEKFSPGGQVVNTFEVENYPGFIEPIAGWELMSQMDGQARRLGVELETGDVTSIEKKGDVFNVHFSDGKMMESKTVIVATGASFKKINVPGEKEFIGKGVSYCATCDGAFYKNKTVAVIGGGSTALEEAHFLTRFVNKVYLIHRRDEFRGEKILQDRALGDDKVEPVLSSVVESINGDELVTSVTVKNKKTNENSNIEVNGVFVFVGYDANTAYLSEEILNEFKEVKVDMHMKTDIPGLFAAGDMRSFSKKQIVTATADGATAAMSAYEYIVEM